MNLTINNHEMSTWNKKFLFIMVDDIKKEWKNNKQEEWIKIIYTNAGLNTRQTHYYSPDKDQFEHGYLNLTIGERAVVETYEHPILRDIMPDGTKRGRWIWRNIINLPMHEFTNVFKFSKNHTHTETLLCAIGAYKNAHQLQQMIDDFEY